MAKERPWKLHKEEGLKLGNLFVTAKKLDDDIITDNGLKSLEECGDTLVFMRNEEGEKRLHGANFCRNRLCQCVIGVVRLRCIRKFHK